MTSQDVSELAVVVLALVLTATVHTASASLPSRARLGLLLLAVCSIFAALLRWEGVL